ncbi:MAG: hypothetical protein JWN64_510 [Parcubacteria group bacterium]|nr:hypothetical protein [Parcubacteria group bacterium]
MKPLISKLTDFFSRLRYGARLRPSRDWSWLLAAAGVLLLASALWNAWQFIRIGQGEVVGNDAATAPVLETASSLEVASTTFRGRLKEELRYKNEYRFVDPSKGGS